MVAPNNATEYVGLVDGTTLAAGLAPSTYDRIGLGYTGVDLTTVSYFLNSVRIRTLTLTYAGGNLTQVTRS